MPDKIRSNLSELVSIVIAPREKHSTLIASLTSLFNTTPEDVAIIACLPQLSSQTREQAQSLMDARRHCELIELEPDLIPHRARSVGVKRVQTPWVIFADNDIHYEEGWLTALSVAMQTSQASVLAPLIFIGPPTGTLIHHAGGLLHIEKGPAGKNRVREKHRLGNVGLDVPGVQRDLHSQGYAYCDVAEFHCLAIRTELLQDKLTLPEQLITREQQHLALQCLELGLKVGFVPEAKVTYMAKSEFSEADLAYHACRWSEERAGKSLDFMEETWNMDFNRQKALYHWIESHRRRPFIERGPFFLKFLPSALLGKYLQRRYGYPV